MKEFENVDWVKETASTGGVCEKLIDGYCTDLDPKQEGCCGRNNCSRFPSNSSPYDGIEWFGAWLVDNAEGEVITEELVQSWAYQALKKCKEKV